MKPIFLVKVLCIYFSLNSMLSCDSDDENSENEIVEISKTKQICSVENPTKDLAWLAAEIKLLEENPDEAKYFYIIQTEYKGDSVFIFSNCHPLINSVFLVKDCSGEIIRSYGTLKLAINSFNEGRIIWKPENFECNF